MEVVEEFVMKGATTLLSLSQKIKTRELKAQRKLNAKPMLKVDSKSPNHSFSR